MNIQLLQIGDHIIQAHNFLGITVSTSTISGDASKDSYEAHWRWGNEIRSQVLHEYAYKVDSDYYKQKY